MSDEAQRKGSAGPSAGSQPAEQGGPGLQPHPLVERLTAGAAATEAGPPSPLPPDVAVLSGYPARDPEAGFWRVYEDLGFSSYVRLAEVDVVATQTLATDEEPLRPSVVWVRRGADLQQTRVETRRAQAGFLEGPLAGGPGGIVPGALAGVRGAARSFRFCVERSELCTIGPCWSRNEACASLDGPCGPAGSRPGHGCGDSAGAMCGSSAFRCGQSAGCTPGQDVCSG